MRAPTTRRAVWLAGLVAAPGFAAAADPPRADEPVGKAVVTEAIANRTTGTESVARALQHAQELFQRGAYGEALREVREPCRLTPVPECTFSIAVLHHALGRCEPALRGYRSYLESDPYSSFSHSANVAATELGKECGAVEPAGPAHPPQRSYGEITLITQAASLDSSGSTAVPEAVVENGALSELASDHHGGFKPPTTALALLAAGTGAGVISAAGGVLMARTAHDINDARAFDADVQHQMYVNYPRYRNITWGFGAASLVLLAAGISIWATSDDQHQLNVSDRQLRYRASF